jgi:hypothetical protein
VLWFEDGWGFCVLVDRCLDEYATRVSNIKQAEREKSFLLSPEEQIAFMPL